jgi:hypothetical protein
MAATEPGRHWLSSGSSFNTLLRRRLCPSSRDSKAGAGRIVVEKRMIFPVHSMRSPQIVWLALATSTLLVVGCGGSQSKTVTRTTLATVTTAANTPGPQLGELLSVPAVGRIYGRCDPGKTRWTIKFVNEALATDGVTYRVGSGRPRSSIVNPGQTLVWQLTRGRYTSHEPADPVSRFPATAIKTTAPVSLDISQGTEPHIYRIKIRLAVAAAIGDTTNCALISSRMDATTYYPGGQPSS